MIQGQEQPVKAKKVKAQLSEADIAKAVENCERLLKRSENNVDQLLSFLQSLEGTSAVLTAHLGRLQEMLKEVLSSNTYEKGIQCLDLAVARVDDVKAAGAAINFAAKGISSTNDENKKLQYLSITRGVAQSLARLSDDSDKSAVMTECLNLLLNQVGEVKKDEQLIPVVEVVDLLFRNGSKEYDIPKQMLPLLKKLAGGNKYAATLVNVVALNYIKARKEQTSGLTEVAEGIFNASVSANLKQFGKTVSQPLMFFSGMNFILLYLHYCEEEAPAKLLGSINKEVRAKMFEVFNVSSHFTPLKYIVQMGQPEPQYYAETLLLMYATYLEDFSDLAVKEKFEYFSTLLNLAAFSGKTKNSFDFSHAYTYAHEILLKKDNGEAQLLIDVFYTARWYLYTINPYRHLDLTFRKDRLNEVLRCLITILVKNLRNDSEYLSNIPNLDDVILTLSHPLASPSWLEWFLKALTKLDLVEECLKTLLPLKSSSPYLWISEYGVESHNRFTPEGVVNYVRFLVRLGAREQLIHVYLPVLDYSNIKDVMSLDVVSEEEKEFIQKFRADEDPDIEGTLRTIGNQVYSNSPPPDLEQAELQQQMNKSKGGKKGQAIQMMDEAEAAQMLVKQHLEKFSHYYNAILKYLVAFNTTVDAREWFFLNYLDALSKACEQDINRMAFLRLVAPYLRSYRITEPFADMLVTFLIQRANDQVGLNTRDLGKLFQLQQLLENTTEIKYVSVLHLLHRVQLYILAKNDFELRNKQLVMRFILNYAKVSGYFKEHLLHEYYDVIVNNINICAHVKESFDVINLLLESNESKQTHYLQIFDDVLNLVEEAKSLTLRCLSSVDPSTLPLQLAFAIKLRVLERIGSTKVNDLATALIATLPDFGAYKSDLPNLDMVDYARKNAREHLEMTIRLLADNFRDEQEWATITDKVYNAAKELESKLEEEQLLFYPNFITVCVDHIPLGDHARLVDLLVGRFARLEARQQLVQRSNEAGVALIKRWGAQNHQSVLPVIEKYMKQQQQQKKPTQQVQQQQKGAPQNNRKQPTTTKQPVQQFQQQQEEEHSVGSSICAVILLGVLSPHLSSSKEQLLSIQQQILTLFKTSPRQTQLNLARCLGDLLAFFPNAELTIQETLAQNRTETDANVKRGQAFLIAGLLRGMGVDHIENMRILHSIDETSGGKKETLEEKQANLMLVEAIAEILGRLVEPYIVTIMNILMKYFGDAKEEIRQISINATRIIMQRLTGYGVKIILPNLFQGIEESKQWRGKIANIWALGNMAYCSPKQLSSCLPLIVSSISRAISDTHPQVRQSANESLELIGSTIQSPEISSIADILIRALSNPFDENKKGLEALLSTNFQHYIDAPALSLLIPIIDYGLRSQDSQQKQLAAKVVGCLPEIIKHNDDLVQYMDMLLGGLEVAMGDALIEVRALAAKAIGRLSQKIGIDHSEHFFKFVWELLNSPDISAIKRSGAANSLAEIVCCQGDEYFEKQLNEIFNKIKEPQPYIKEGYVGTIIYIPGILHKKFEPYIKDVIDNINELVNHDEEHVRSITLRVLKIMIQNYAVDQNELLYPTLNEGMKNEYWKKRNAAVLLSGEMLGITQDIVKKQLENPQNVQFVNVELYVQNLMLIYIMRQDETEQVRHNANNIWKTFIENTPRWVKRGLRHLVRSLADVMNRPGLLVVGVNTIQSFCQKYGESHIYEVLSNIGAILSEERINNLSLVTGAYSVLDQLYRFTDYDVLVKHQQKLIELSREYILTQDHTIKKHLFRSVGQLITKFKSTQFLEDLIAPYLDALQSMDESNPEYLLHLEIFDELCHLNNQLIMAYLVVLILAPPLDQYKIDIITNNAYYFARVIYIKSADIVPINVLFQELFRYTGDFKLDHTGAVQWPNRTSSLIYCIGQLSINLTRDIEDNVTHFIRDILGYVDTYAKSILADGNDNVNELVASMELLQYFLHNTAQIFHMQNPQIIPKAEGEQIIKVQALKLIHQANEKGLNVEQFSPQLAITYAKIAPTLRQTPEGLKYLSKNYARMFVTNNRRDYHLNELFNRAIQAQTDISRESYLKIVQQCIKQQGKLFSKPLLERISSLAKLLFDKLTNTNYIQPYQAKLLGDIVGLTSSKGNVPAADSIDASPAHAIFYAAYFRHNPTPAVAERLHAKLRAHLSLEDTFVVDQSLKMLYKLRNIAPFSAITNFRELLTKQQINDSEVLRTTLEKMKQ